MAEPQVSLSLTVRAVLISFYYCKDFPSPWTVDSVGGTKEFIRIADIVYMQDCLCLLTASTTTLQGLDSRRSCKSAATMAIWQWCVMHCS